jgi:uncharacterized protein (TIGR02147 family)
LPDFKLDPKWIRRKLKFHVNNSQIKEALRFLIDKGFLLIDPTTGKPTDSQRIIQADSEVLKMAMSHAHREVMDLASKSIYVNKTEEHHLVNYTLSLPQKQFMQVKTLLAETLDKIQKISAAAKIEETDTVYSISMHAFPLTHSGSSEEDSNAT